MKSKTLPAWARLVCTAAAALVFLLVYEWAVYGVSLGKMLVEEVLNYLDAEVLSPEAAARQRVERRGLLRQAAFGGGDPRRTARVLWF